MTGPHAHSHTQARKQGEEILGHSLTQALHALTGRRYVFGTFRHPSKHSLHYTSVAAGALHSLALQALRLLPSEKIT